jgi:hypothetical protein
MYLYFRAYDVMTDISISFKTIQIIYNSSDPDHVSIQTNISISNPTDISLRFNSVWETLKLNGRELGENYYYVQHPPHPLPSLPPHSNVTIPPITITNVLRSDVDVQPPRIWQGEFFMFIYDIPIIGQSKSPPFIAYYREF